MLRRNNRTGSVIGPSAEMEGLLRYLFPASHPVFPHGRSGQPLEHPGAAIPSQSVFVADKEAGIIVHQQMFFDDPDLGLEDEIAERCPLEPEEFLSQRIVRNAQFVRHVADGVDLFDVHLNEHFDANRIELHKTPDNGHTIYCGTHRFSIT